MRRFIGALALTTLAGGSALAATDEEVQRLLERLETLEREQQELKSQLEEVLQSKEEETQRSQEVETAQPQEVEPPKPTTRSVSSGNLFNPEISVIIDGNFYHDGEDGEGQEILSSADKPSRAGLDEGEEGHGGFDQGFNLRDVELVLSSNVDRYFYANARVVIDDEGDVELEEAWFQTLSLPLGLQLKGGKFKSDFGYINRQHPHQWDFVDQNLPYRNLLGEEGIVDIGGQLTLLPNWGLYTLFGFEALQGSGEQAERFGAIVSDGAEREAFNLSSPDDGPRQFTGFVKVSPELGFNHALQVGASVFYADQHQEIQGEAGDQRSFDGDGMLYGLEAVYKYDQGRAYGHGNWLVQAEYLYEDLDLTTRFDEANPGAVGRNVNFKTDGAYLQGRYGFLPRWQVGLRYDVLGLTNKIDNGDGDDFGESDRWTAALTWSPSEFSRFRLQAERASIEQEDGESEDFNVYYLQYILSLGSHGAHQF